jgi:DNA modification methylase
MKLNTIENIDCIEGLRRLPDESVDCCITSPPYYGLRDYGVDGQIGLEDSPEEFVLKMVEVFAQVKRVLKKEGTLWLNLGDSYWGGKGMSGTQSPEEADKRNHFGKAITKKYQQMGGPGQVRVTDKKHESIKAKDLIGIPWMVAFALRSSGWYLRQDIIWHKPNPMPESVTDRCTKSHEYIFLLSKSRSFYYDAYSIRTPYADKTFTTFGNTCKGAGDGSGMVKSENWQNSIPERKPKQWKTPDGWDTGKGSHGSFHKNGREKGRQARNGIDTRGGNQGNGDIPSADGANKRSVWTVAAAPFKDAHFATFPEDLIVDCIKAGCPENGIVLDPFMGAGTTAMVAQKLHRNFIGFELNADYIRIAVRRLKKELGLFYPTETK